MPYTFGAQSTIIILVNFQDDAVEPYAVADAQNMFFGTGSTLNSFILENSYGQTSITGTVVGWYTIPVSVTTCDISQIATDAQNAATANGANLSNYTRYVYLFPYTSACAFAGASNVGGNPSQSWINGTLDSHVIDHELGHAFGLWHAHLLDCGATATICSNGTIVEYGDPMDVMGQPQTASPDYNAFQKERLGWLNYGASPSIQIVTTGGTYTIYPYEVGGSGPNALKILKSTDPTTGAKTWYYLEARQAIGFDAFLTNSIYYTQNETTGVLFHLGTDGNGNNSELLDMTPATPATTGWLDMSLAVGQTFQDARAGVTFTPAAVDSTGATVEITFGPAVSLAVSGSTFTSGQKVTYTANVLSGGAAAAGASVTFTITEANGSTTTNTATANSQGVATWSYKFGPSDPKGTWSAIAQASYNSQTATGNTTTFTVQ